MTSFLFLSIFTIFHITNAYSQDDDGFFGIFPNDYYDPNDYGETAEEEQTIPEQLVEDQTNNEEIPTLDNYGDKPQSYLSDIKSKNNNNINFIAAGDWSCNKETQKTIEKITKLEPELVVGLGDYTFEEVSPQCWFDISEPIDDIIKIAIGNHDLDYQSSYYQLLDHYNLPKPYYFFNFQNIHFVTISSEHPFEKGSRQYEFIKNDLEESLQDPSILWRIVFLHKPMYSASDFDEKDSEELKDTFHELFESHKVDLVLSGHTQYYQRSLPLSYNNDNPFYPVVMDNNNNNQYTNQNGIIFMTAGTAGDELHDIDYLLPYYVIQEQKHGFLNFELTNNGETLLGTFHDTDDPNILDKFVISKDRTGMKTFSEENFDPYDNNNNNFHFTSGTEKSEISNKNQFLFASNSKDHSQTNLKAKS
ncbi:MAG TPA: metallophosphoesterase [Nitrososphaeraceae archaeon]|nr:metallophosphoesterase [Nitrososphaeraceae archaeon]